MTDGVKGLCQIKVAPTVTLFRSWLWTIFVMRLNKAVSVHLSFVKPNGEGERYDIQYRQGISPASVSSIVEKFLILLTIMIYTDSFLGRLFLQLHR